MFYKDCYKIRVAVIKFYFLEESFCRAIVSGLVGTAIAGLVLGNTKF